MSAEQTAATAGTATAKAAPKTRKRPAMSQAARPPIATANPGSAGSRYRGMTRPLPVASVASTCTAATPSQNGTMVFGQRTTATVATIATNAVTDHAKTIEPDQSSGTPARTTSRGRSTHPIGTTFVPATKPPCGAWIRIAHIHGASAMIAATPDAMTGHRLRKSSNAYAPWHTSVTAPRYWMYGT